MDNHALAALAQAAGVTREWTDAAGTAKTVSDDSLRAVLNGLELPCATEPQARDTLAQLQAMTSGQQLLPLHTAVLGQPVKLALHPSFVGQHYRLTLEQGGVVDGRIDADTQHGVQLAAVDRYGYHRLDIGNASTTLAVAPPRCFGVADALGRAGGLAPDHAHGNAAARCWGLGVQLYSLRRAGDGGIGDFTGLQTLTRAAAAQGAATVAISPVHAMFSGDTSRYSPYGPSSRLFINALHIDPETVAGAESYARARTTLGHGACSELATLEQDALVDWPRAARLRLDLLRVLYRQKVAAPDGQAARAELAAFRQRGGQALEDHARFEMLHGMHLAQGNHGDWHRWAPALRDPRSAEVAAFAAQHAEKVNFHVFLQWQAARGLASAQACARSAGMPIGLIADLAIGADRGGSQAWSRQRDMINGLSVGAPPDIYNPRGQSWGLGAFSPQAMLAHGFQGYIEMLRAVFAHCGGVRIDHVLGLARLWLVPEGASAADGAYLQFPLDDLLRLIALESHRHHAIVIGEDLGTVPPGFDTRLASAGLLGIRVLFFERAMRAGVPGFKAPPDWSADAIATTTTHDLPTVAGWWRGVDIDWRSKLDLLGADETAAQAHAARATERRELWDAFVDSGTTRAPMPDAKDAGDAVDAAVTFIAATPAPLAIVPIEDVLGLPEQPNLPGTIDTHPNWRRRLLQPVDHLFDSTSVQRRCALLNQKRALPGAI